MALLPPHYLDIVVALGHKNPDGTFVREATGFLYGRPENDLHRVFLVTNRHVFSEKDEFITRFNRPIGSEGKMYNLSLKNSDGSPTWVPHNNEGCDVAAIPIAVKRLEEDGIEFKYFSGTDERVLSVEKANETQISEGDGVFVLGFPLENTGEERSYTIVRQGIIARILDWKAGKSRTFLIDASVFPGSSGSPVILRPEISAIEGTKNQEHAFLIGMISSYIPYKDIAVSSQTGQPRVVFQENSGLANVVPIDVIREKIDLANAPYTPPLT